MQPVRTVIIFPPERGGGLIFSMVLPGEHTGILSDGSYSVIKDDGTVVPTLNIRGAVKNDPDDAPKHQARKKKETSS